MMTVIFRKHCAQPWFDLVRRGEKTIEGRLFKGDWKKMRIGDEIVFFNGNQEFKGKIINLYRRESFFQLISEFKKQLLPGIDLTDINNGVEVYRQYFSQEDEKQYGVLGLRIQLLQDSKL